jgi:hypothetical protein
MPTAVVRFHGSLNDFLPARRRDRAIEYELTGSPGIRDVIQALGVPHPEVDRIVVNGSPVGFEHRLDGGERADVFGLDRADEPGDTAQVPAPGLIPAPPEPPRFVLDGHLGRLARYLRMLGFDATYDNRAQDAELARISAGEDRILLTRDRGLLKRSAVRLGYLVRDDDPRRQLGEVVARYRLDNSAAPFSRCVRCSGSIEPVAKSEVVERLAGEPRTLAFFESFGRCAGCGAIYWPGSHFERMSLLAQDVLGLSPRIGENPAVTQTTGRSQE